MIYKKPEFLTEWRAGIALDWLPLFFIFERNKFLSFKI